MSELSLAIQIHLFTVIPAILLGIVNLSMKKGTSIHKLIGSIWVLLMLVAAIVSFWIRSEGGYSWIHILSVITITNVILGFIAIKRGNLKMHIGCISGAFMGALVAGMFAVVYPGRFIYTQIFG